MEKLEGIEYKRIEQKETKKSTKKWNKDLEHEIDWKCGKRGDERM